MNRIRIILSGDHTLHELLLGIAAGNVVLTVISGIVAEDKIKALLGIFVGMLLACFYIIHMAITMDDALCLDEKGAASELRKHMLIRYMVVFIVTTAVCYFKLVNPVTCILGILTVKIGVYLQPLMHKLIKWR